MSHVSCLISFVLCVALCAPPANAIEKPPDYSPGVIIVKFSTDDESEIDAFLNRSGAYSAERAFPGTYSGRSPQRLSAIYKLEFSSGADVVSMVRQYEKDPVVEYAQPNYLNYLCDGLNDLFYEDQWALWAIDAQEAWKIEKGSSDVVIAIVDTGVDYEHEDLKSRIWINPGEIEDNGLDDDSNGYVDDVRGWDFADSPDLPSDVDCVDRDNDPMDENGHGTHVAGVVGAVPNNGKGTAGVTWNCRIMALRGGGKFLEDDDLSAAIIYAADNGAHVINMSWGGEHLSYIVRDSIEYAYSRGCVLVAAVGNDDRPAAIYPALHKQVIAVGATDRWDKKASFSNYGPGVDIVAPGHRVFGTTLKDKYSDWSGTSMASPVVAGVAALMLSRRPGLTSTEIAQILRSSADEIDDPLLNGIGRVNAANALAMSSSLIASITWPDNGSGADTELDIRGTAAGFGFQRFQLEYAGVSEYNKPAACSTIDSFTSFEDVDWLPIAESGAHAGTPLQHSIYDDLLAVWKVAHLEEGDYVVRLKVFGDDGLEAEDRLLLNIDHSPPEIRDIQASARLDEDRYRYAVAWKTDDLTSDEFYYRSVGSHTVFNRLTLSSESDEHTIYTSDELSPGSYEYFITATNRAGLVSIDDNSGEYYPLEMEMLRVTSDGVLETATDVPALHPVSATSDFDGDGRIEIVGMESTKYPYDTVRIYEKNETGSYEEVFAADSVDYFPWDIGDTDGDGLFEILGNKKDLTYLYESPSPGSYPTERIWEMEGIWGGRIADMDMDGQKEIVSRHLDTNELYIYENRGDRSYLRTARMPNPTEGDNFLSTTFAISDFDGDGCAEVVVGDWDGELFIYENVADDRYSHVWTGSVPNSRIRYITSGDFDGDGKSEFVVEARADESPDVAKRRWIYTIFDHSGRDGYEAVWSHEVMGIRGSASGVSSGDVDGDGSDEIVVLVTPNLYIFKIPDSPTSLLGACTLACLHHHLADKTQWPIIEDLDADGANEVIFNSEGKLTAFEWSQAAVIPIQRPWGLNATPLGEAEVELRWNGPPEAISYRIYRGLSAESLNLIASIDGSGSGFARDSGLRTGAAYWYSVTSFNAAGRESERSDKVSVTPNSPPRLISAEYVFPFTVRVAFSEPMGPSAQSESRYEITSESGISSSPSSAILDSQGKRVVLTLEQAVLTEGLYTVTAVGIRDASGVTISADGNSAIFRVPAQDAIVPSDLSRMIVYPNPVMPNSRHPGRAVFDNLPPAVTVRIYDSGGQLVRKLNEAESGRGRILWYLDNDDHREVASGIYVYIAESARGSKVGKLAVIR